MRSVKLTSSVIDCVRGLRGDALKKAAATKLYDRVLDEMRVDSERAAEQAELEHPRAGAFDGMQDDIPWPE